ncbi:hypothetical protein P3T73_06125 [Kiritimatiellota bacterium B12222]|nr:hypothetical protein P3T73_06125 [Kiritimatiellota bacterium B12222]
MSYVKCPNCGTAVDVPKKSGSNAWIGCLIAVIIVPVVIMVIGLLAAIALPSFAKARDQARDNACMHNLSAINAAKTNFAIENELPEGRLIESEALLDEADELKSLTCPSQGTYILNPVGISASCSVHGAEAD